MIMTEQKKSSNPFINLARQAQAANNMKGFGGVAKQKVKLPNPSISSRPTKKTTGRGG
jgi:hypothetical protein